MVATFLTVVATDSMIYLVSRNRRSLLSSKKWVTHILKHNSEWLDIYIYIIQILSVCLSSIGGQTAGPIMTKFGTNMRIDLGMVPTKYWPLEWPGSVGSLGPISESGLSCQLLLRAVVWQMTSQLIRRRNDVVFAAFNQPVSMRPMNGFKSYRLSWLQDFIYPLPSPPRPSPPLPDWAGSCVGLDVLSTAATLRLQQTFIGCPSVCPEARPVGAPGQWHQNATISFIKIV